MHKPEKIISGGQKGADLGGSIGAKRVGIATGGFAPKGYKTEVGPQPDALRALGLQEHASASYPPRTKANVEWADATLILATEPGSRGTQLTIEYCGELDKPYLMVDPSYECVTLIREFLDREKPKILNIAGNRESKSPGLTAKTAAIIEQVFGD